MKTAEKIHENIESGVYDVKNEVHNHTHMHNTTAAPHLSSPPNGATGTRHQAGHFCARR